MLWKVERFQHTKQEWPKPLGIKKMVQKQSKPSKDNQNQFSFQLGNRTLLTITTIEIKECDNK